MQHYFINKPHLASDYFTFTDNILNYMLNLKSCDNIFSKNKIDEGTRSLLETVQKQCRFSGNGLDLGCGLGVIGITMCKLFDVNMELVDINQTAVELTNFNLANNGVKNAKAYVSDGFSNVKNQFDFIISNPPIKTGKKLLFQLMEGAYNHLKPGGELVLVIRKDHGMESLKNYLNTLFNQVTILNRNKGYYILQAIKN